MRAYSHGAKIALDAAKIAVMQNCLVCSARCTYNRYGKVSALVADNGGAVDDTVYEGNVLIKFHIKPDLLPQLNKKLADATAGEVQAVLMRKNIMPLSYKIFFMTKLFMLSTSKAKK